MNEIESTKCCGQSGTNDCCLTSTQCPCMSTRTVNGAGQTIQPGTLVELVVSFNGNGSYSRGGSPNQNCCCYSCSFYSFSAAATYECISIISGECGCSLVFDRLPGFGVLGEPTQAWFDPLPNFIALFHGPGAQTECISPEAFPFCPECPPGTQQAGQKAQVHWQVAVAFPPSEPECTLISSKNCTKGFGCVSIGCNPSTVTCGPYGSGEGVGVSSITTPCQGECGGGEAAVPLWACDSSCSFGGCWRNLGTLTATWYISSYGSQCNPLNDPLQPCVSCQ